MAEAVKKPSWWGILMIFPVLNLVALGYLAFSKMEKGNAPTATPAQPAA